MANENAKRQWPDAICSGSIRYGKSDNYDGFYLADAAHGIPTFASVADTSPVTIQDQHVRVFNYPGQTEAIASQLVDRWNAHNALTAERDRLAAENERLRADRQALYVWMRHVDWSDCDVGEWVNNKPIGLCVPADNEGHDAAHRLYQEFGGEDRFDYSRLRAVQA